MAKKGQPLRGATLEEAGNPEESKRRGGGGAGDGAE